MLVIGLTGGIGSGKTAASDHFKTLGIDIIDADIAARTVVEPNQPGLKKIAEHFGENILLADGNLDRAALREKIFSDPDEKQWLEALLHPLIRDEINRSIQTATSPYVIFVSPLLLETDQHNLCNRILVIDVPEEIQIERAASRDDNTYEQIQKIIASQIPRQQRLDKADDVISNTKGLSELHQAVEDLHKNYLSLVQQ